MTIKQIKGMLRFTRKAEKGYRRFNQTENANQARAHRARLIAEYLKIRASR